MAKDLPRFSTGISGLDAIFGGGLIEGASYIIQGHPGAGKTIVSNQIAFAAAGRGVKVLYVTLLAETHERLFQALGTLDFFDETELGNRITYVSVFQTLRDEGLSAVVRLIREEIARQQASLLVFDGLLNARDRANTELDVKTFVAEVQSQAAFVGCTVLFLTSARVMEDSPEYTMVDGVLELHHDLHGVRASRSLHVRKSRGSGSLGGLHQFEISGNGVSVYPRLEQALAKPSVPDQDREGSIPSGTAGFDTLLGGGLPEGSVTLVFGPSGSGKTSFGLGYLARSTRAEPGLLFGFYETRNRLLTKARALGIDLETPLAEGALDIVWNPMTENILDKLAYRLLDDVRSRGIRRLLIDGLGGFERAAVHPARLVEFFAALTNELRAIGVTTMATWELRDMLGPTVTAPSPEISSLLDNLVMLRNVQHGPAYWRTVSVLKVRDRAFDAVVQELSFETDGPSVRPLHELPSLAKGQSAQATGI